MNSGCQQTLAPNRTVVTSFTPRKPADGTSAFEDGDWVLCLASSSPSTLSSAPTVSCALSNGVVKVYDQESLHPVVSFTPGGRSNNTIITDLIYGTSVTLIATEQDGSVVVTDLRQPSTSVSHATLPHPHEAALAVSLELAGSLVAVASDKGRVHFLDWRMGGQLLGSYVDSHRDAVTQVVFHPEQPSLLVSAGEDGLVCLFDTTQCTEELALSAVINLGAPGRRVGFCGDGTLYCLTGSETASLWDTQTTSCLQDFEGLRLRDNLSSSSSTTVDYLVDAHWDATRQELVLCAGDNAGNATIFTYNHDSQSHWQASHGLVGGHRGVVRAWRPLTTASGGHSPVVVTVGEDARLCEWIRVGQRQTKSGGVVPSAPVAAQQRVGRGGPMRRQRRQSNTLAAPY